MTKLEEVARAHHAKLSDIPWESLTGSQISRRLEATRAAIEALREPSEAMAEAGLKGAIAGVGGCWRAMVDAALAEKPS